MSSHWPQSNCLLDITTGKRKGLGSFRGDCQRTDAQRLLLLLPRQPLGTYDWSLLWPGQSYRREPRAAFLKCWARVQDRRRRYWSATRPKRPRITARPHHVPQQVSQVGLPKLLCLETWCPGRQEGPRRLPRAAPPRLTPKVAWGRGRPAPLPTTFAPPRSAQNHQRRERRAASWKQ